MSDVLTHARQDPALGIAPVFTALPKATGRNGRPKLDVRQTFGDATIEWRGPDALGPGDQTVLLALLALGAVQNLKLSAHTVTEAGHALRANLRMDGDITHETFVAVRCTWRELIEAAGLRGRGGSTRRQVKASVRRLADVGVWVTVDKTTIRSQLLAWRVGDDNEVTIALNWRLSRAICDGHHARISLVERRALRSEPAQVLHSWLSSCLRPGGTRRFRHEHLIARVWLGNAIGSTLRTRHSTLKLALTDIGHLPGWVVRLDRETATVSRAARVKSPTPPCQSAALESRETVRWRGSAAN